MHSSEHAQYSNFLRSVVVTPAPFFFFCECIESHILIISSFFPSFFPNSILFSASPSHTITHLFSSPTFIRPYGAGNMIQHSRTAPKRSKVSIRPFLLFSIILAQISYQPLAWAQSVEDIRINSTPNSPPSPLQPPPAVLPTGKPKWTLDTYLHKICYFTTV